MRRICCAILSAALLLCGCQKKDTITYQVIDPDSVPPVPDETDRISYSINEISSVYFYVNRDLPHEEAIYIWDFETMTYTHRVNRNSEIVYNVEKTISEAHAEEIASALNACYFYNWQDDYAGYEDTLVVHTYPKDGVEYVYSARPAHHKKQGYDELNAVLFSHGFYMDDESDKGESENEYNTGNRSAHDESLRQNPAGRGAGS